MISAAMAVLETEEQRNILSEFYLKAHNRLYAIAYSKLHNSQSAEDAVQETFLRIATHPEKFFSLEDNKRHILSDIIIRNVSIDMIRKNCKVSPEELSEEFVDEMQLSLEDSVLGEISRNELLEFINTLPRLQKDVLTLHGSFGFSGREIAEELGISETAVRQRLYLARKAVIKFVESRVDDERTKTE